eukprot:TRINITY_DN49679_c0_g1_i1.p1 TRINITY_DN49679_c0_g1~~TRINITY_DN49679_c0_g1_i1.p1  ORF type:complete len:852 (+),score=116.69 TRINITY_DN49679_c0_g1_i1:71-2626(+)
MVSSVESMRPSLSSDSVDEGKESQAADLSIEQGSRKRVNFSSKENWLFADGVNGSLARSISAKSDVVKAMKSFDRKRYVSRRPWIESTQADVLCTCMIVLYAVVAGIEIEIIVRPIVVSDGVKSTLLTCQFIFAFAFVVELGLRIAAAGWTFCSPLHNVFGFCDTFIIVLGAFDLVTGIMGTRPVVMISAIRLFRLLRLARIFRVLAICRELRMLMIGMVTSISAVFWTFALIFMFMYCGAIMCVSFLGRDPELSPYFGSVPMALFTHFVIVTLEAWPEVSDLVMETHGWYWAIYFMSFICITSLALVSLITGVVCDTLMRKSDEMCEVDRDVDQVELHLAEMRGFKRDIEEIVARYDKNGSGGIDVEEFLHMLRGQDTRKLMDRMDVSTNIHPAHFFETMDMDGDGSLSLDEVFTQLMRLRGSRRRLHSILLQRDVVRSAKNELAKVRDMEQLLCEQTHANLEQCGESLLDELESIQLPSITFLPSEKTAPHADTTEQSRVALSMEAAADADSGRTRLAATALLGSADSPAGMAPSSFDAAAAVALNPAKATSVGGCDVKLGCETVNFVGSSDSSDFGGAQNDTTISVNAAVAATHSVQDGAPTVTIGSNFVYEDTARADTLPPSTDVGVTENSRNALWSGSIPGDVGQVVAASTTSGNANVADGCEVPNACAADGHGAPSWAGSDSALKGDVESDLGMVGDSAMQASSLLSTHAERANPEAATLSNASLGGVPSGVGPSVITEAASASDLNALSAGDGAAVASGTGARIYAGDQEGVCVDEAVARLETLLVELARIHESAASLLVSPRDTEPSQATLVAEAQTDEPWPPPFVELPSPPRKVDYGHLVSL